jgi:hypothetical protein
LNPQLLVENPPIVRRIVKRGLNLKVREYWRIELEIRVYVGVTGLTFEVCFDGEVIGREDVYVPFMAPVRGSSVDEDRSIEEEEEVNGDKWMRGLVAVED